MAPARDRLRTAAAASGAPVVGVDIASPARLSAAIARRPALLGRVFTAAEQRDCAGRAERLAGRWAAKEAVRKLAGSLGVRPLPDWLAIEVRHADGGRPLVTLDGVDLGVALSLSHEAEIAVAVAVLGAGVPGRSPATGLPLTPVASGLRLPERPADGHKGTFGTVAVLAGSHGFSGAAYLAAMGAARGGAGRVRLCVPAALHPAMSVKCTEVMPHPLPDGGGGAVGAEAIAALRGSLLTGVGALVLGPGLGTAAPTAAAIIELLGDLPCPSIVDADALTIAARGLDWSRIRQPVVLTPHPAEMARLVGSDARSVQADRHRVATEHAARWGVVVVLKGAETVIAAPDGRVHTDASRIVALATGGTGDVLGGLCGALLASGAEAFEAAVAAVAIHAEAGAALEATRGRAGALASDLLDELPAAQERLRRALERRDGELAPRG